MPLKGPFLVRGLSSSGDKASVTDMVPRPLPRPEGSSRNGEKVLTCGFSSKVTIKS